MNTHLHLADAGLEVAVCTRHFLRSRPRFLRGLLSDANLIAQHVALLRDFSLCFERQHALLARRFRVL